MLTHKPKSRCEGSIHEAFDILEITTRLTPHQLEFIKMLHRIGRRLNIAHLVQEFMLLVIERLVRQHLLHEVLPLLLHHHPFGSVRLAPTFLHFILEHVLLLWFFVEDVHLVVLLVQLDEALVLTKPLQTFIDIVIKFECLETLHLEIINNSVRLAVIDQVFLLFGHASEVLISMILQ